MEKTLIYCMVWENELINIYAGLAYYLVKSLRGIVEIKGDIIIFTDSNRDWSPHSQYSQIKKVEGLNCHVFWRKAYLGATQDFSNYDRIIYLDVDLIILAPLSSYLIAQQDLIQFESTHFTLKPNKPRQDFYGWSLIEKSLDPKLHSIFAKKYGLNTSLVYAERDIFIKFCKQWWENQNLDLTNDQSVANWLVYGVRYFKGFPNLMPWLNLKGAQKQEPKYWEIK